MSTQGPYSPGTVVQSTANTLTWANINNVKVSDNNYATIAYSTGSASVKYLDSTNFGFTIPAGATINGITVEIEYKASHNTSVKKVIDHFVQLYKGGSLVGANKGASALWPLSEAYVSFGGTADLWSTTWTPEEINSSGFGAMVKPLVYSDDGTTVTGYVDHVRITITYSEPAPTAPTGLTRTNFDATGAADFTWTFNDPTPTDSQTAYQLLIYDASDSSLDYDSGKVTSAISLKTLAAATLTNNKQYQWQVRCYDQLDQVSPYSSLATFYTSAKPVVAVTTPATDGATVATSTLTVVFAYSDTESGAQSAYQAVLLDALGGTLEDSGKVTGATLSHAFAYTHVNATNYGVRVTVWDDKDIASTPVTRTFTVAFAPPPTPTITATPNNTRGSIAIAITNPPSLHNLISNGDFADGTVGWTAVGASSFTVSANTASFTPNATYGRIQQYLSCIAGHKYYIQAKVKASSSFVILALQEASGVANVATAGSGSFETVSALGTAPTTSSSYFCDVQDGRSSGWNEIQVQEMLCIDLTIVYGTGNEPTQVWCDANIDFDAAIYPVFSHNEVFRKKSTETTYTRIATDVLAEVVIGSYTADLCTGGTTISGGDYASYPKGNAFDDNNGTRWGSSQGVGGTSGVAYIGYNFGAAKHIRRITIFPYSTAGYNIASIKVQSSADGSAWSDVTTLAFDIYASTQQTFDLPASSAKQYWRLLANADPAGAHWYIFEIQMMAYATHLGATFTDYTPPSGVTYNYFVRAIGDNTGYADSAVSSQTVTLTVPQIALTSDYSAYETFTTASRSKNTRYEETQMLFAGRAKSVSEFSEHEYISLSINTVIDTDTELSDIEEILSSKGIILYRDERGRKEFVTVNGYDTADDMPDGYRLNFTLNGTSYTEEV